MDIIKQRENDDILREQMKEEKKRESIKWFKVTLMNYASNHILIPYNNWFYLL